VGSILQRRRGLNCQFAALLAIRGRLLGRVAGAAGHFAAAPGVSSRAAEPNRLPVRGEIMADKSPRQNMSKKAGKTLKEKRTDKHAKAQGANKTEIVPPTNNKRAER
jgi:hypothetical protein